MTAMTMVGSILATLNFFSQIRLTPTLKMSMEPVRDRLANACSVIQGSMKRDSMVMHP